MLVNVCADVYGFCVLVYVSMCVLQSLAGLWQVHINNSGSTCMLVFVCLCVEVTATEQL